MNQYEAKLECLRLADSQIKDTDTIVKDAKKYFDFIYGTKKEDESDSK